MLQTDQPFPTVGSQSEGFIQNEDGSFEKKDVELGLSDGINVEIIEGVEEGDKIKVWNKATEEDDENEFND